MKNLTLRIQLISSLALLSLTLLILSLLTFHPLWASMHLADRVPGAAHAGPDLLIESITLDPAVPTAGSTADIAVIVKNQGDTASGGYRIHLYVDPADDPLTADTPPTGTTFNGFGIGAGASASPWTRTGHEFTTNNWKVCAWVDRDEQVTEDNEENNQLCIMAQIEPTPTPPPPGEPDAFEQDDLCTDAETITTDDTPQTHNLFREGDEPDVDWVTFAVTGGINYTVEAIPVGNDADLSLELHTRCDGDGTFPGSGTKMEFTAPTNGIVYFRVSHNQETYGPNTDYQLKVSGDANCSNLGEPNDLCALPVELTIGLGPKTFDFCASNDVDWMRVRTKAGAKYKVEVANEGNKADAQFSLFTSCDQANAQGQTTEFTTSSAGFAYLKVQNLNPEIFGAGTDYSVEVTVVGDQEGCEEDRLEQDDTRSNAQPLNIDSNSQKHNTCPAADEDWMYFDATGGVTYTVETLNLGPAADTVLCLYDDSDTELLCDDDNGPGQGSRLTIQVASDARYWVKAKDYDVEVAGDETAYEVQVLTSACQNDGFEPNDERDIAKAIAADGTAQNHNVCPGQDSDWSSFTATANTSYVIKTVAQNQEGDTILELYDGGGQLLARNDDHTPGINSQLVYEFSSGGTYYVKTTLYNPSFYGTGTEYELSIAPGSAEPTPTPTPAPPTPPPPPPSQPTEIRTLILVNRAQIVQLYDEAQATQLMDKLTTLAQHEKVRGEIIRLDNNGEVSAAYAAWNADLGSVTKANLVAGAIRRAAMTSLQTRQGIEYVVLVGDDRGLPFRRFSDNTSRQPESTYKSRVDSTHPTGAAIHENNYLVDDFYVDMEPTFNSGHEIYIPDFAIGRLIETPQDMIATIDNFLASSSSVVDGFYVSGYDFVRDFANYDCEKWGDALENSPGAPEPECLIGTSWSKQDFIDEHMKDDPPFKFQSINGHGDHFAEGVAGGGALLGREIKNLTHDMTGGLVYTLACHAGLNVPPSNAFEPIDLPEAYVNKGVVYIANTGYGWGLLSSIGLSERVVQLFSQKLRSDASSVGVALKNAKNLYYEQDPNFSAFDEKVMQQLTLYGLPMFEVEVGGGTLGDDDPFPNVGFDTGPLPLGTFGNEAVTRTISIEFPQSLGNDNVQETEDGSIISLNGFVHADADEPVLPLHFGDISAPNPEQQPRSVVVLGAEYTIQTDFDPVIAAPYNEYYTDTTELEQEGNGWFPPIPTSVRNHAGTANLVTRPAQYNLDSEELLVYSSLDVDVYYSTSSDEKGPEITVIDSLFNPDASRVNIKVGAMDESGIGDVVVSYIEDASLSTTNIKSLNLDFQASSQKWVGAFDGNLDSRFFVQVVDNGGNMTTATNKGLYYAPVEDIAPLGGGCPLGRQCVYLPMITR